MINIYDFLMVVVRFLGDENEFCFNFLKVDLLEIIDLKELELRLLIILFFDGYYSIYVNL